MVELLPIDLQKRIELEIRHACSNCVREQFLSKTIEKIGEEARCFYCQTTQKTMTVGDVANRIDAAFEHHYRKTAANSEELGLFFDRDDSWQRSGCPALVAVRDGSRPD